MSVSEPIVADPTPTGTPDAGKFNGIATLDGSAPSSATGLFIAAYNANDVCIGKSTFVINGGNAYIMNLVINDPGLTPKEFFLKVLDTVNNKTYSIAAAFTGYETVSGGGNMSSYSNATTVYDFTEDAGGGGGTSEPVTEPIVADPTPTGTPDAGKFNGIATLDGSAPSSATGLFIAAYNANDVCIGKSTFVINGGNAYIMNLVINDPGLTPKEFFLKVLDTVNNKTYSIAAAFTGYETVSGGGNMSSYSNATTVYDFTEDAGGGSVAAPSASGNFTAITSLTQGTSATTTETLASIFTGDGISYTYSVTGSGVSAATSGDKVQVTADSGAAAGDYTVTVTATNDGGTATATISVKVVLANLVPTVSTPFPNLSFGKSTSAGSYVIENVLSHFTDADNAPNPLSISSVSVTSGTNVSVSNDNSADTITIDYAANPDVGSATIKVTATDGADSVDATFTSTISVTKGIYLWTYQDTANNYTTIKMKITTEVIKVPGIHLKYSATSGLSFPDQETTSPVGGGSASAYSSSGWQQSHVNSDTATPYIVLFGDASKALGSGDYDLAYFESLFTISDIVGISDQHGNLVNANNYALSEPPIIFEDTTRDPATDILYGDVNVSESLNAHDLTMLAKYLVGNDEEYTGESGPVKAVTYVNGKIADNNDTYAWIDVNKNGEIDVGDACRLAEKLADANFNIIGDRDK